MTIRSSRKRLPAPKSLEELDIFLARLAENLQALEKNNAEAARRLGPLKPVLAVLNEQIQLIKKEQDEVSDPLNSSLMDDLAGVLAYVEKNWNKLSTGKTLKRPAGLLKRRDGTKETIEVVDEDAALEWLEQNGHSDKIREKSEVNKDILHQDLELARSIPGISVFMDARLTFETGDPSRLSISEKFSALRNRLLGK